MINRNNYEEYFLLLADNELSEADAAMVKQFVAQHPDLAEELDILMSCRLESIVMPAFPKEKLLRPVLWSMDTPEPLQTRMLLLLDGELSAKEKQQLEMQIAASITLQTEWKTLQQTKLTTETIAHPNKELLRRFEHKVRPVLWMRWAAAAAVVAGLGWMFWLQQEPESAALFNPIASNTIPVQPANTLPQTPPNIEAAATDSEENQTIPAAVQHTSNSINRQVVTRPKESVRDLAIREANKATSNPGLEKTPADNEPIVTRPSSADINLTTANPQSTLTPQIAQLSPQKISLMATSQKLESFTGSKSNLIAEDDDYVTIGGAHVNKQKMRGLFRNVTRTVARSFTKSKVEPDVYATR